jgi:hypothetical protein
MATKTAVSVTSIAGAMATDDGNHIILGVTLASGEIVDLAIPHEVAINLMALNAGAVGQAARNRNRDPTQKYVFPVEKYEVGAEGLGENILVHFRLPGGLDLGFRIPRDGALRFYESLGAVLGVSTPSLPSGTRPN